jgi:hypothetical protein
MKPKGSYRVYKIPKWDSILRKLNPVYTLKSYFSNKDPF